MPKSKKKKILDLIYKKRANGSVGSLSVAVFVGLYNIRRTVYHIMRVP